MSYLLFVIQYYENLHKKEYPVQQIFSELLYNPISDI
jgi:hypothetical protein